MLFLSLLIFHIAEFFNNKRINKWTEKQRDDNNKNNNKMKLHNIWISIISKYLYYKEINYAKLFKWALKGFDIKK